MKSEYTRTRRHFVLQIGSEKLKFSTPNKSFIKGLTNFALAVDSTGENLPLESPMYLVIFMGFIKFI